MDSNVKLDFGKMLELEENQEPQIGSGLVDLKLRQRNSSPMKTHRGFYNNVMRQDSFSKPIIHIRNQSNDSNKCYSNFERGSVASKNTNYKQIQIAEQLSNVWNNFDLENTRQQNNFSIKDVSTEFLSRNNSSTKNLKSVKISDCGESSAQNGDSTPNGNTNDSSNDSKMTQLIHKKKEVTKRHSMRIAIQKKEEEEKDFPFTIANREDIEEGLNFKGFLSELSCDNESHTS